MGSPESRTRVGVIGVGYFGRFHALKFMQHPRARLVGVVDSNPMRLVDVAAECSAQAFTALEALIGQVDAVSIATPAEQHGPIARDFLKAGIHVLVEKPLAASLDEADQLIGLAKAGNLVLQVGHQERAVLAASGLFDIPEAPSAIHCIRKGPFSGRNGDVDVVLDLMTHDLDMVHALNDAAVVRVEARGSSGHTALLDEVVASLTLADGAVITVEGSRASEKRERSIALTYPCGRIAIDFLSRQVENTTPFVLQDIFPAGEDHANIVGDPLGFAVDRFLAAVRGEALPLVSGQEGRMALASAEQIRAAAMAAQ